MSSVVQGERTAQLRADLLSESLAVCHTPARRCTGNILQRWGQFSFVLPRSAKLNGQHSSKFSADVTNTAHLSVLHYHDLSCRRGKTGYVTASSSLPFHRQHFLFFFFFHLLAFSERPLPCHHTSQCYYYHPSNSGTSAHVQPKLFEVHFWEVDELLRWNPMWEPGAWPGMWHCGNWPRQRR